MRKLIPTLTVFAALVASSVAHAQETLRVAASPVPHAEILEFVKPKLKAQGIDLEVKVFSDYVQPNLAVADKVVDANFFQHKPYLDAFNRDRKTSIVAVPNGLVHVEPFGAYSLKIKRIADLPDGATIAIPTDPSNTGRALVLLQKQGLIKLKDPKQILATTRDIVENPKRLVIRAVDPALLPRALPDVDLALINTNYALEAKLVPTRDALFIEGADSPYANLLAARSDNAGSAALKTLTAALHTPEVKKFIEEKYKGAVVPAF
jgi:D-methionine transport system substrate-binding protein